MLYFENDYAEGAHPAVLKRLCETNLVSQPGYGEDAYSEKARRLIREALDAPEADIFFLSGGTQTNAVAVGGLLRPWEGVLCASTGHINTHEGGAVEFTGHKVLPVPHREGKLSPADLHALLTGFYSDPNRDHEVFPGMVYISHPTEYGTLYTLSELEHLSLVCKEFRIPLYVDGARLAYALGAGSDVTLADLARLCDVFYIGGTKCGALCGEALVFPRGAPEHFLTVIKQRGALLAKGRLVGAQFEALFTGDLYRELGRHAVAQAARLRQGLRAMNLDLFIDSPTNLLFPILPVKLLPELAEKVRFSYWEPLPDGRAVIRLATCWATRPEDVTELLEVLRTLVKS